MKQERKRVEPLAPHHERGAFSCGVPSLDRYLIQQARQDAVRRVAAVFVLVGDSPNEIAGYYTLSASSVRLSDVPQEFAKRLPRYPLVPAILLGRLAVDTRFRGHRHGEYLLLDALDRSLRNSAEIGATAIIVDAKDLEARSFYERYGFTRFSPDASRLFLPMKTVEKLLR